MGKASLARVNLEWKLSLSSSSSAIKNYWFIGSDDGSRSSGVELLEDEIFGA